MENALSKVNVFLISLIFIFSACIDTGSKTGLNEGGKTLRLRNKMSNSELDLGRRVCDALDEKRIYILSNHFETRFPFSYKFKSCIGGTQSVGLNGQAYYHLELNEFGTQYRRILESTGQLEDSRYLGQIFETIQTNFQGIISSFCQAVEANENFYGYILNGDQVTQFRFDEEGSSSPTNLISVKIEQGVKREEVYFKSQVDELDIYTQDVSALNQDKVGIVKTHRREIVCEDQQKKSILEAENHL